MLHNNRDDLNKLINNKREEMIKLGIQKGLDHEDTINISKELDQYIIKEQKLRLRNR